VFESKSIMNSTTKLAEYVNHGVGCPTGSGGNVPGGTIQSE
jgi:hypothetical protein